ncbi:VPRE2 protein, partial [Polyodon spathula]|nr:VPRE2 protein [Polyodon spathula]
MIFCNYSLSSSADSEYLFWYKQTPGSSPRYLLHRIKGSTDEFRSDETEARFSSQLDTSQKITSLTIVNTQLCDSAVYLCALSTTVLNDPSRLNDSTFTSIIQCTYETAGTANSLFWYIQDSNQAPQLILNAYSQAEYIPPRFQNRLSASPDKKKKTFHLNITVAVLSDSATYFCARSPTL